jgi:hypothetical protein
MLRFDQNEWERLTVEKDASFPRTRESRATAALAEAWIPDFAGMTKGDRRSDGRLKLQ